MFLEECCGNNFEVLCFQEKQPAVLSGTVLDESKSSSVQEGTAPEEEESQLIGRETEISRITKMLDGDPAYRVIFVSGMAGVGKSALVDCIYHSPDIKRKFPRRAWADVLQPFDPEEFLMGLALQLKGPPSDKSDLNLYESVLSRMESSTTKTTKSLHDPLQRGKHLIVVDGLSSETGWDHKGIADLREAAAEKSWTIIVTTREASVGKQCSVPEGNNIVVECLEYADAFKLFKTKVSDILN